MPQSHPGAPGSPKQLRAHRAPAAGDFQLKNFPNRPFTSEKNARCQAPPNMYSEINYNSTDAVRTRTQGSSAASCMPWMIFLSGGQKVASAPLSTVLPSMLK